jgi:hypothetical protein
MNSLRLWPAELNVQAVQPSSALDNPITPPRRLFGTEIQRRSPFFEADGSNIN